ncbi:MAG: hypothetical protein MUO87_07390 [Thermoplasmata archaeon]|nr:hypothetical protein [Thermoplasmata archaeon]
MMGNLVQTTEELGVTAKNISAIKMVRSRERLVGFLRSWWVPIASSVAGFVAGLAPMLALEEEQVASTYPYAAAMVSAAMATSTSRKPVGFWLMLAVPVFLIAFMAGLGIGDVVSGDNQFGVVTEYGVQK